MTGPSEFTIAHSQPIVSTSMAPRMCRHGVVPREAMSGEEATERVWANIFGISLYKTAAHTASHSLTQPHRYTRIGTCSQSQISTSRLEVSDSVEVERCHQREVV